MAFLVKKKKPHPNNQYNGVMVQSLLFPVSVIVISCFYKVFKHYKKKKISSDYAFCQDLFISYNGVFSLHAEPDSLWTQQLSNSCQADS